MEEVMKCLIIDDEPPARELLKHYLARVAGLEVVGECANGFEALKMIQALRPDILFLDIQMPKIDGFELLELLENPPEVIFCTAYDTYALKAFELNAVDYLLKPFSEERLHQAVARAMERIQAGETSKADIYGSLSEQGVLRKGKNLERIIAKNGTHVTIIPLESIYYLEAQGDYVMVCSKNGNHLKEKTMKYYEETLPTDHFIRVHRSYIVNIRFIQSINLYGKESYKIILTSGDEVKASASGYRRLKEMM